MTSLPSKESRRYLLVVENQPVPFDRRVWQQACALRDDGHQVTVICPSGKGTPVGTRTIEGIRVRSHPMIEAEAGWQYPLEYGAAFLWEGWCMAQAALSEGFDVIQVANPPDTLFLTALPYTWFGKKLVYDQHDLAPELYEAKFARRGVLHQALSWFERGSLAAADQVICVNDSCRDRVLGFGTKPSKVAVVRNGPKMERFANLEPAPNLRRGFTHLVVFIGLMGEQEGLGDLLDMLVHLREDHGHEDVLLVLAGDGPARAHQERRARALGLEGCVEFTGMLDDERLGPLLATADICVSPDPQSVMNDYVSMVKVMEYMAAGKPVVQYDLKEARRTAEDASLYARPGDSKHFAQLVHELLEDESLRRRLGETGLARVRSHLQWDRQKVHYLAVMNGLSEA